MKTHLITTAILLAMPTWASLNPENYKAHEEPALRALAAQVEDATASMPDLLKAEEAWLQEKITNAVHETTRREAQPHVTPKITQAEMRLAQNIRQQLTLAERAKKAGGASASYVSILKTMLYRYPHSSSRKVTLKDYLHEAEESHMGMVDVALEAYRTGTADIMNVLEKEAECLSIRVWGMRILPHVPDHAQKYLEQLHTNLQEQLNLVSLRRAAGGPVEGEEAELQEKLSSWFPEK